MNAPTPNFIVIQVDQTCPDWVVTVGPQVVGPATMSGDLLHTKLAEWINQQYASGALLGPNIASPFGIDKNWVHVRLAQIDGNHVAQLIAYNGYRQEAGRTIH